MSPSADSALPPPLMTSEEGSFARRTIIERKPRIIQQVIDDNDYPDEIVRALEAFRAEIASEALAQPLSELVSDASMWNEALAQYQPATWLELPWYFAETFFYRRLLEATRYVAPGPWMGRDPFEPQKRDQIRGAVERLTAIWDQLPRSDPQQGFDTLMHSALWGNRTDLSNRTVSEEARNAIAAESQRQHLLIDDTAAVKAHVTPGLTRVDFVHDNVGLDLLFDLALIDLLLEQRWAMRVVMHLKDAPFFVSDAMIKDVRETLAQMRSSSEEAVQKLPERLGDYLTAGRLILRDEPFWTTHRTFRQMPESMRADLSGSDLVVLKGDVNYRRLLGDRHWPHAARLSQVAGYFPAPVVALRTLKAELIVGLEPGQAEALATEDPDWLINGQRGLIHALGLDG